MSTLPHVKVCALDATRYQVLYTTPDGVTVELATTQRVAVEMVAGQVAVIELTLFARVDADVIVPKEGKAPD